MRRLAFLIGLALASPATAQENQSITSQVLRLVQDACRGSSVSGSVSSDSGNAKIDVPGTNEQVEFSRQEWKGVQQVLKEHQARDNASYRDCIRELSPIFLEAETRQSQTPIPAATRSTTQEEPEETTTETVSRPTPQTESTASCPFEFDGTCDVPFLCPAGTDLADCGASDDTPQTRNSAVSQPLFCAFENDGYCDVPSTCPFGTDLADCSTANLTQPLPQFSDPQSSTLSCDFENDGECDVPGLCPFGTDLADCSSLDAFTGNSFGIQDPQLSCCDVFGNVSCVMNPGQSTYVGDVCFCPGFAGTGLQCF